MQQPMAQQEQIGNQQLQQQINQQMVLCPVRLVYETQILVQPGEQIQPNQTFFINPNNPPPWMQNRPAPNPVMYVQQLPNNMMQAVQQPIDQNQLYLQQNFANYQLQQQILAQNSQEIRPTMQMANILPNMVQNVQQTMQNERTVATSMQNAQQIQMNNQQTLVQNQINVANTRQIQNQVVNQNQVITQNVDAQRQVFMQMRPQMVPQTIIQRPVMSMNQVVSQTMTGQPTQQTMMSNMQNQQAIAGMQNVQVHQQNVGQMYVANVGQRAPQNMNNVRSQAPNNVVNVQPVAKVRENTPTEPNKPNTNTVGSVVPTVRNMPQNYAYRPIQPRPQINPNVANVPKSQTMQVQTAPTYGQEKSHTHQNIINIAANTTFLNNSSISRKRKSESPDEVQKKIAANAVVKPNYAVSQQSITVTKLSHDIGVNTSPKHVRKNMNQNHAINASPQIVKLLESAPVTESMVINTETNVASPSQNEKDKLIRNTVFTQARGRVLQDKDTTKPNENSTNMAIQTSIAQTMPAVSMQNFNINDHQRNNTLKMEIPIVSMMNRVVEMPKTIPVSMSMPSINATATSNLSMPTLETNTYQNLSMPRLDTNESTSIPQMGVKANESPSISNVKTNDNTPIMASPQKAMKVDLSMPRYYTPSKPERRTYERIAPPQIERKPNEHHRLPQVERNTDDRHIPEVKEIKTNKNVSRNINENVVKTETANKKSDTNTNLPQVETRQDNTEMLMPKKEKEDSVIPKVEEEQDKQLQGNRNTIKQEKDFILTHVVDGYVIQESNFAFPIRKPLKEKTLQANTKTEDTQKDLIRESIKEELKSHAVDIPLLPFHYLLLNNDRDKEEVVEKKEEIVEEKETDNNPFSKLQQTTVKTWTVEDLSKHLLQHNWKDTVSVLQDHEIDGESLFLVSKPQLVTIGVSEEHADVICEFVKS